MIKLLFPLPKKLNVACSGGVDSMALLDFLKRSHDVTVMFFNHGTEASIEAENFLKDYCQDQSLNLKIGKISSIKPPKGTSKEEHWRNERYFFFSQTIEPIVTAHHLDDCVETWVWGCLHGTPQLIPIERSNVLRPILTTPKQELVSWCERKNVPWIEDTSNLDAKFTRNYIRHELLPKAYQVNPGLRTVIKKMIENKYKLEEQ